MRVHPHRTFFWRDEGGGSCSRSLKAPTVTTQERGGAGWALFLTSKFLLSCRRLILSDRREDPGSVSSPPSSLRDIWRQWGTH
jgi:hypothetical protein